MLMGRFSRANLPYLAESCDVRRWTTLPALAIRSSRSTTRMRIGKVTKTFSPSLFGEFVVSWARWFYQSSGLSNGFDPHNSDFLPTWRR